MSESLPQLEDQVLWFNTRLLGSQILTELKEAHTDARPSRGVRCDFKNRDHVACYLDEESCAEILEDPAKIEFLIDLLKNPYEKMKKPLPEDVPMYVLVEVSAEWASQNFMNIQRLLVNAHPQLKMVRKANAQRSAMFLRKFLPEVSLIGGASPRKANDHSVLSKSHAEQQLEEPLKKLKKLDGIASNISKQELSKQKQAASSGDTVIRSQEGLSRKKR